jgi:hypothetical protein
MVAKPAPVLSVSADKATKVAKAKLMAGQDSDRTGAIHNRGGARAVAFNPSLARPFQREEVVMFDAPDIFADNIGLEIVCSRITGPGLFVVAGRESIPWLKSDAPSIISAAESEIANIKAKRSSLKAPLPPVA